MKRFFLAALFAVTTLFATASNAAITYLVDHQILGGNITGTITVANTGVLAESDFLSWDLTIADGLGNSTDLIRNTGSLLSQLTMRNVNIYATGLDLTIDMDTTAGGTSSAFFLIQKSPAGTGTDFWCFGVAGGCLDGETIRVNGFDYTQSRQGEISMLSAQSVSTVPLPAGAWLFLSALGGLAGLRKAKSVRGK